MLFATREAETASRTVVMSQPGWTIVRNTSSTEVGGGVTILVPLGAKGRLFEHALWVLICYVQAALCILHVSFELHRFVHLAGQHGRSCEAPNNCHLTGGWLRGR